MKFIQKSQEAVRDKANAALAGLEELKERGNDLGINQIISKYSKQTKLAGTALKSGAMYGGDVLGGLIGDSNTATMGAVGAGTLLAGNSADTAKEKGSALYQARLRQKNNAAGVGAGTGDVKAAGGNTISNTASMARNLALTATGANVAGITDFGPGALSYALSPGYAMTQASGGLGLLGANAMQGSSSILSGVSSVTDSLGLDKLSGLAASGSKSAAASSSSMAVDGAMSGILPGVAATILAAKAAKGAYKWSQEESSSKTKVKTKNTITTGTQPHELENKFGNLNLMRREITKLVNMNQISPADALQANLLSMIEAHTSVIPLIAANSSDSQSIKDKEGGNAAQKHLDNMFGDSGVERVEGMGQDRRSIFERIATSIELGSANASMAFDPAAILNNFLNGRSTSKLYNEANNRSRDKDPFKAEKKFGEQFGVASTLVQAIHTTPAQIMNKAKTFEAKQLSILGLISEINRFSAHELLKIRTDGFGLTSGGKSHGRLAQFKDEVQQQEDAENNGIYESWGFKAADEALGYIPIFAAVTSAMKMGVSATRWSSDLFKGDIKTDDDGFALTDDNGNLTGEREKNRTSFQVLLDYLGEDVKNVKLDSELALRDEVGATELSSTDLMASYLGGAYPDQFELLLDYNLSQKESLESLAGDIERSKRTKLTMNKYDGKFREAEYHRDKDEDIRQRVIEQSKELLPQMTWIGDLIQEKNKDRMIQSQIELAIKNGNTFLRDALADNDPDDPNRAISSSAENIRTDIYGEVETATSESISVDDIQEQERILEESNRKLTAAERQVIILEEIRDCLDCSSSGTRNKANQRSGNSNDGMGFGLGLGGGSGNSRSSRRNHINSSGGFDTSIIESNAERIDRENRTRHSNESARLQNNRVMGQVRNAERMRAISDFFNPAQWLRNIRSPGFAARLIGWIPILGPALLNPVVQGVLIAGMAAAAGYAIHQAAFGEEDGYSNLTDTQKRKADRLLTDFEIKVNNLDEDKKKSGQLLKKSNIRDLNLLYQAAVNDGDDFMISVLEDELSRRGIKHQGANIKGSIQNGIDYGSIFNNSVDDNKFKKETLRSLSGMNLKALREYYDKNDEHMNFDMKKKVKSFELEQIKSTEPSKYKEALQEFNDEFDTEGNAKKAKIIADKDAAAEAQRIYKQTAENEKRKKKETKEAYDIFHKRTETMKAEFMVDGKLTANEIKGLVTYLKQEQSLSKYESEESKKHIKAQLQMLNIIANKDTNIQNNVSLIGESSDDSRLMTLLKSNPINQFK